MRDDRKWGIITVIIGVAIGLVILDFIQTWIWSGIYLYLHEHPSYLTMTLLPFAIGIWAVAKYWKRRSQTEHAPEPILLAQVEETMKGE